MTEEIKETAEEKFKRLAEARVNAIMQKIRIFSNLSGPAYKFDEAQVDRIFQAIRMELDEVENKFQRRGKNTTAFTL